MRLTEVEAQFDGFVRRASPRLLRAAWLLVGDWAGAEDLVQTALERSWPKWAALPDDEQRQAYVHRVLTNAFLRGRRRRWTGEIATAELPEPLGPDEADEIAVRTGLVAAVRGLPPRQRAVVALRYLGDLTEAQTALAMGCSVGTVKRYHARAITALRADPSVLDLLAEGTKP
jgi:RNA polymerase sigma-70 factor (sigma-E family)